MANKIISYFKNKFNSRKVFTNFIDKDKNIFIFSGESCLLEKYKCFDDKSSLEWIDGQELLDNPDWTFDTKKIWYYFYRPYNYGNNIAPKQKKYIVELTKEILALKGKLKATKLLIFVFTFLSSVCIVFGYPTYAIGLFFLILVSFKTHSFEEKQLLEKDYFVSLLQEEIDYLHNKQKSILDNMLTEKEVENIFWLYMQKLEEEFLKVALNKTRDQKTRDENSDFYDEIFKKKFFQRNSIDPLIFPLIASWGILQQQNLSGAYGTQKSGLYFFQKQLDKRIATWRNTTSGKAFYRVWYLQFLFFQEKSLYVVSTYIDLITKKRSGLKQEVFSYNHIAHHAYNEEDVSYMLDDELILKLKLPEKFTQYIYNHQSKSIYFASSSGAYYRCTLPSQDISNGLKTWSEYRKNILYEEEQEKIKDSLDSNIYTDDLIFDLADITFKTLSERIEKFAINEDFFQNAFE